MSDQAHTPGPWRCVEREGLWFILSQHVRHPNADGIKWHDVAYLCTMNGCGGEDARLIAAAPEMLEALKDCIDLIREEYSSEESIALDGHPIDRAARKVWDAGWEAIAKATSQ